MTCWRHGGNFRKRNFGKVHLPRVRHRKSQACRVCSFMRLRVVSVGGSLTQCERYNSPASRSRAACTSPRRLYAPPRDKFRHSRRDHCATRVARRLVGTLDKKIPRFLPQSAQGLDPDKCPVKFPRSRGTDSSAARKTLHESNVSCNQINFHERERIASRDGRNQTRRERN